LSEEIVKRNFKNVYVFINLDPLKKSLIASADLH